MSTAMWQFGYLYDMASGSASVSLPEEKPLQLQMQNCLFAYRIACLVSSWFSQCNFVSPALVLPYPAECIHTSGKCICTLVMKPHKRTDETQLEMRQTIATTYWMYNRFKCSKVMKMRCWFDQLGVLMN